MGAFGGPGLIVITVVDLSLSHTGGSWSVRVYVAARETHGRVCPLCYLLPVGWVLSRSLVTATKRSSARQTQLGARLLAVRLAR